MYLKVASLELAQQISQAMYELSVINASGGTQYLYDWIEHPTTGEVVLNLRDDIDLSIHRNADVTKLDDFLSPFITVSELDAVHLQIEAHKGQKLKFVDFIPPSLSNRILTEQDLIDKGWYPDTDI